MASEPSPGIRQLLPSALEAAAKVAALVAAASALIGLTYNVAFFAGSKQEWLFYLSIADNLTATLYALPFVVLVVGLMILSIPLAAVLDQASPLASRPPNKQRVIVGVAVRLVVLGALGYWISRSEDPLRAATWLLLGFATTYLPAVAWRLLSGSIGEKLACLARRSGK